MIVKDEKKMFDAVYKHHAVVFYKHFDIAYKFKISRPKYLSLWCLFLTIKWVQKGVYGKGEIFLLWDRLKMS